MYLLTSLLAITLINNGQSLSISNETDSGVVTVPNGGYVVGGEDTEIECHPHQVSLQIDRIHNCGGSILSANYILTAAHCLPEIDVARYTVRAGSSFHDEGGSIHQIDRITRNENTKVSEVKVTGDIAVVHLVQPLKFDDTRQPITLFEASEKVQDDLEAVATGWGSTMASGGPPTKHLQMVTVPIINHEICKDAYPGKVTAGEICAGYYDKGGKDTCIGDSGGPLTIDGKLAGITSWGVKCGRPYNPGVYVNVAYYRDWIDKHSQ